MYQVSVYLKRYKLSLFFSLLIIVFGTTVAQGQRARTKTADRLRLKQDYQGAIEVYLDILDRNNIAEAKTGIAECYWKLKNYHEVEYWYGLVVQLPQASVEDMKRYAIALHSNQKYDKAKKWCEKYLDENPADMSVRELLKSCNESTIENLNASGALYKIKNLAELNSSADDFGAAYYKDGIVFASGREQHGAIAYEDPLTGNYFTELFFAQAGLVNPDEYIYNYSKPKRLNNKLNHAFNDGPACFSKASDEVYLTRNNMDGRSDDKVRRLKIYRSDAFGTNVNWSKLRSLPFNSDEYSVMHPSLSKDGSMLFFSSDMPGGFGSLDLYVSYLENGRWSPPINLGPTINTESSEWYPFIHEDGTLYFSSSGHAGLGGFDLFFSKEVFGSWSEPTNIGYPVSSTSDDFGLILNEKKTHGYFSSDRDDGVGRDDIYSFTKLTIEVEVLVFDENSNIPLENADVRVSCSPIGAFKTNSDGKVFLEIPVNKACDFSAEKQDYTPNSLRKDTKGLEAGDKMFVQIPLKIERIYDLVGIVEDGIIGGPLEGAEVILKMDCGDGGIDEQQFVTDAEGKYEFAEIMEDCTYEVTVSKKGYTTASVEFSTGDLEGDENLIERDLVLDCETGNPDCPDCSPDSPNYPDCLPCNPSHPNYPDCETQPCSPDSPNYPDCLPCSPSHPNYPDCVDPENPYANIVGPKNLLHIFYDFDKANVRKDAQPALDTLLKFMGLNPGMVVMLTSHTDARGAKQYNRRLSNRRAESAVRYLISSGIKRKRIKAKGLGETVMLNACYDGLACNEEQHQENRRTEFQIVAFDYKNGRKINIRKSEKPSKIVVDPCKNCKDVPAIEADKEEEDLELPPLDDENSKKR